MFGSKITKRKQKINNKQNEEPIKRNLKQVFTQYQYPDWFPVESVNTYGRVYFKEER